MKPTTLPYVAICPSCGAVVCIAEPEAARRSADDWAQFLRVGLSVERIPAATAKRAVRRHSPNCALNQVEFE